MKHIFILLIFTTLGITAFSQDRIYWGDDVTQAIYSSDFNGSNIDTLITGQGAMRRVRLDKEHSKLYWTNTSGRLYRSDLNGSNIDTLFTVSNQLNIVEIDNVNDVIYFTESGNGKIQRCNLDGTGVQDLIAPVGIVQGIEHDSVNGHIYWTEMDGGKIKRADDDGSNVVTIYTSADALFDLQLDESNEHIYFSNRTTDEIMRIGFNGSGPTVITGVTDVIGVISIDLFNDRIYWVEVEQLVSSDLNGGNIDTIVQVSGADLRGMDVNSTPVVSTENIPSESLEHSFFYPNPAGDRLQFSAEITKPVYINILSVEGRLIHQTSISTGMGSMDISFLPSGLYLFMVEVNNDIMLSQKVIKN